MARRVEIDIDSDANVDGFEATAAGADHAASRLDAMGDAARGTKRDLEGLDRQILETRAMIAGLGGEIARTGDLDLLKKFKKDRESLNALRSVRKEMQGFVDDVEKVGRATKNIDFGDLGNLSGVFSAIVKAVPPQVLIPTAASLAIPLGAALNGALLLVGGSALLAGGIVGAFQNTKVRNAWVQVGQQVKTDFVDSTKSLFDPLIDSASQLGGAFKSVLPEIRGTFTTLAPEIKVLTDGISGLITNLAPGLERLAISSKPLIDVFAKELPVLGSTLTQFFDDLGKGSGGAAEALEATFAGLNVTIGILGTTLRDASVLFELFGGSLLLATTRTAGFDVVVRSLTTSPLVNLLDRLNLLPDTMQHAADGTINLNHAMDLLHGTVNQTSGEAAGLTGASAQLTTAMDAIRQGAGTAAEQVKNLRDAQHALLNEQFGLQGALINAQQAIIKAGQAFDVASNAANDNSHAVNGTSEAALRHREALLNAVESIATWRQKMLDSGLAPAYVSGEVDKLTRQLYDNAVAHGADKRAVGDLIDQWRTMLGLPSLKTLETNIITRRINIVSNYTDNTGSLPVVRGQIVGYQHGGVIPYQRGGVLQAARGLVAHGPTILFGERETGDEALIPRLGVDRPRARSLIREAAGWHGFDVVDRQAPMSFSGNGGGRQEIVIRFEGEGELERALVQSIRRQVDLRGAGDVQKALGRR